MPDIIHRVGIKATPAKVFGALATIDGLAHWWTTETKGNARKGGTIDFGFCGMKVTGLKANRTVAWKCVQGPKEWIGTEVAFELKPDGRQTFVLFIHSGWKKPTEFMRHCSTKWAIFLMSLRSWLETGEGR